MIIEKSELVNYKHIEKTYDFSLSLDKIKNIKDIISFEYSKVNVTADYISSLALVKIHVKGKMILRSTRTLQPVEYYFSEREEVTYSFYQDEDLNDENIVFIDDDKIDIDEEVISLIITSIPIKIIGKDESDHFEGDGYEVMSEDEYLQKNNHDTVDPRFASLSSLFDEEEK
ncbi:MAG: YceD family protein [Bacilli bacterium]